MNSFPETDYNFLHPNYNAIIIFLSNLLVGTFDYLILN